MFSRGGPSGVSLAAPRFPPNLVALPPLQPGSAQARVPLFGGNMERFGVSFQAGLSSNTNFQLFFLLVSPVLCTVRVNFSGSRSLPLSEEDNKSTYLVDCCGDYMG